MEYFVFLCCLILFIFYFLYFSLIYFLGGSGSVEFYLYSLAKIRTLIYLYVFLSNIKYFDNNKLAEAGLLQYNCTTYESQAH